MAIKLRKPKSLRKAEFLELWGSFKRKRKLAVRPVPYQHKGSTFDQDGIRITGTRKFIEAILSRLTELLPYEGAETRLQVSYKQATNKETGQPLANAWVCYIQVHKRGEEAIMVNLVASALAGKEIALSRGY